VVAVGVFFGGWESGAGQLSFSWRKLSWGVVVGGSGGRFPGRGVPLLFFVWSFGIFRDAFDMLKWGSRLWKAILSF